MRRLFRTAWFGNAFLVVVSIAIGLCLLEGLYRVWLSWQIQLSIPSLDPKQALNFSAESENYLLEDRQFGFRWRTGKREYLTAHVVDGLFDRCEGYVFRADSPHSAGRAEADPSTAALRILVFGDSFSTMMVDDETWPSLMERYLTQKLGFQVSVQNVARGGYGVLQMIDQAAIVLPQAKPDLFVVAYITNDLIRTRWWVYERQLRGRERVLIGMKADGGEADPKSLKEVSDYLQINRGITKEWCSRMTAAKAAGNVTSTRDDAVMKGMLEQRQEIVSDYNSPLFTVNFWTVRRSFVINRIMFGNPYIGIARLGERASRQPVQFSRFEEDESFRRGVEAIRQAGVPGLLVHIPHQNEIIAGREFYYEKAGGGTEAQGSSLRQSLEDALGTQSIPLVHRLDAWRADPLAHVHKPPADLHPSGKGLALLATAIGDALIERGIASYARRK